MSWPNEVGGAAVQRVVDVQAVLALEHSDRDTITAWQTLQLKQLIQWLLDRVPVWRERLGDSVNLADWERIPVLSRFELHHMIELHGAAAVPAHHGQVSQTNAGAVGSVGAGSNRSFTSEFAQRLVNHAFYADHQRQGRNPFLSHASISDDLPVHRGEHLISEASLIHGVGPQWLRNLGLFSKSQHMQWIAQQQPVYLTVRPDWFEVALVHAAANKEPLPEIRQILTFGATATDSLRRKARKGLGASVRHRYTSPQCGPLAFQCPHSDDYHHVAVSNVKLEIVDEAGQTLAMARGAGAAQAGRVLITALHQYATPLLRYDSGDRAALHDGCPACGLAIPTLSALRQNV